MKRIIKTFVLLGFLSLMLGSCDSHNGYVDLGLSVKWATCNVGARSPEEHGEYYAYDDALQLEKDGKRLPSKLEFRELIDNCDWTWTTRNGVNGYKVTSRKNDNSIFLPAAGVRGVHNGTSVTYVDYNGFYCQVRLTATTMRIVLTSAATTWTHTTTTSAATGYPSALYKM